MSSIAKRGTKRRWRFRYSIRHLMALVAFISLGLSFSATYFAEARLDGNVHYCVCMCGPVRAKVSGGNLILLERHHDTPAGTIVATIEVKDGMCTFTRIETDGTPGPSGRLYVDHLGVKYYDHDENDRLCTIYVLTTDNWKRYPALVERLFH